MATDQAHEQNNACVKGDGGAVGLTENPAALRRWMIAGPEVVRVISEFESSLLRARREMVILMNSLGMRTGPIHRLSHKMDDFALVLKLT